MTFNDLIRIQQIWSDPIIKVRIGSGSATLLLVSSKVEYIIFPVEATVWNEETEAGGPGEGDEAGGRQAHRSDGVR